MAEKTVIDFDLDRYLRASKKLDLSELGWDEIPAHELSDGGRQMLREIDRAVSEMPGLEGLTLLEDALDAALERAARRPGWAGVSPAPAVDASLRGAGSEAWGASRGAAA